MPRRNNDDDQSEISEVRELHAHARGMKGESVSDTVLGKGIARRFLSLSLSLSPSLSLSLSLSLPLFLTPSLSHCLSLFPPPAYCRVGLTRHPLLIFWVLHSGVGKSSILLRFTDDSVSEMRVPEPAGHAPDILDTLLHSPVSSRVAEFTPLPPVLLVCGRPASHYWRRLQGQANRGRQQKGMKLFNPVRSQSLCNLHLRPCPL